MSRIHSNALSGVIAGVAEGVRQSQPTSAASSSLSQASAQPSASLTRARHGVSSFEPTVGILPSRPGGDGAGDIRNRLNTVLQRIPGYQNQADQIASQLSPLEQRLLATASPEERPRLEAQIWQQHAALAQQMRGDALAINRPFSPLETNGQMMLATWQVTDIVNQTFDAYSRQLDEVPMDSFQRFQLQQDIEARRSAALQEIENNTALMGRRGASFEDVMAGKQRIEQSVDMLTRDLTSTVLSRLPLEHQPLARAEIELQRMDTAQAVYNHFSHALQPSSPTDFNQLPGGAPSMQGPLTPAQAQGVLSKLESGIERQYQARLQEAGTLPPEQQAQVRYGAQLQRDRMLVSAYRNVLGRVMQPVAESSPYAPAQDSSNQDVSWGKRGRRSVHVVLHAEGLVLLRVA